MHYSVSWSGGKDSTASIILAHLHGDPVDSIVFAEVMFDIVNGISGENPQHIDFINVVIPFSKPSESERQPKSAAASIGHRRFDG